MHIPEKPKQEELYQEYTEGELVNPKQYLENAVREGDASKVRRCLNVLSPELPLEMMKKELEATENELKQNEVELNLYKNKYRKEIKALEAHALDNTVKKPFFPEGEREKIEKLLLAQEKEKPLKEKIERLNENISKFEKLKKYPHRNIDKMMDISAINGIIVNLQNAKNQNEIFLWKNILKELLDTEKLKFLIGTEEEFEKFSHNLIMLQNKDHDEVSDIDVETSDKDNEISNLSIKIISSFQYTFGRLISELANNGKRDFNLGMEKQYKTLLQMLHLGTINPKSGEAIWEAQNLAFKTDYPDFKTFFIKLQELKSREEVARQQAVQTREQSQTVKRNKEKKQVRSQPEDEEWRKGREQERKRKKEEKNGAGKESKP